MKKKKKRKEEFSVFSNILHKYGQLQKEKKKYAVLYSNKNLP